uniref:Uncharacterized protein n=1 Tax=Fagus sylvatica TaxID=28930 RepID=A0A2N9EEX1_FAGSY
MATMAKIRARARAPFATTHHRRHHQQCQGSLTGARTPSRTHSHSHRGSRSGQGSLTGARQPPWPWTRALKLSPSHSYGSKPHGFDDGTTVKVDEIMVDDGTTGGAWVIQLIKWVLFVSGICEGRRELARQTTCLNHSIVPYFNLMSDNS